MKIVLHIALLAAAVFLLSAAMSVSPYRYWFDPRMRQVSEDSVLFLWMIYVLLVAVLIGGGIAASKQQLLVKWVYAILLGVAFWRMINLALIA